MYPLVIGHRPLQEAQAPGKAAVCSRGDPRGLTPASCLWTGRPVLTGDLGSTSMPAAASQQPKEKGLQTGRSMQDGCEPREAPAGHGAWGWCPLRPVRGQHAPLNRQLQRVCPGEISTSLSPPRPPALTRPGTVPSIPRLSIGAIYWSACQGLRGKGDSVCGRPGQHSAHKKCQ